MSQSENGLAKSLFQNSSISQKFLHYQDSLALRQFALTFGLDEHVWPFLYNLSPVLGKTYLTKKGGNTNFKTHVLNGYSHTLQPSNREATAGLQHNVISEVVQWTLKLPDNQ